MKDFGFNAGGPVIKDKIWWWAAYGVQQINTLALTGGRDDTVLNNYTAKLNFQLIPENRAEIYFRRRRQEEMGPQPQRNHPRGMDPGLQVPFRQPDLEIPGRAHVRGQPVPLDPRSALPTPASGWSPATIESLTNAAWYDLTTGVWCGSQTYFYSTRPHPYVVFQAQYFADNLFGTGTAHEIKLGVEMNNTYRTYVGGYPGNFYFQNNDNAELGDFHGVGNTEVLPFLTYVFVQNNDLMFDDGTKRYAMYFSDNVTFGRFNFNLRLRYDYTLPFRNPQTTTSLFTDSTSYTDDHMDNYASVVDQYWSVAARDAFRAILPTKNTPYVESGKASQVFSPASASTMTFSAPARPS